MHLLTFNDDAKITKDMNVIGKQLEKFTYFTRQAKDRKFVAGQEANCHGPV